MKYLGVFILLFLFCGEVSGGEAEKVKSYTTDIDWDKLVSSVIMVESSGNPNAVSPQGCIGLMQINPNGVLKEFNNFVDALNGYGINRIYWLNMEGSDLVNTNYKAHYGWKKTDKKGWCLRLPKFKGSMELELYHCPIQRKDLFNSKVNIFIGTWYLLRLQDHYKCPTIEHLLASYNGGITRLRRNDWDIEKMPRETRDYVKKVMRLYYNGIRG